MADHNDVMAAFDWVDGVDYPVLVPNMKGFHNAVAKGARTVAVIAIPSETFATKHVNCSAAESVTRAEEIARVAIEQGVACRAYVSCALGCPFEGPIPAEAVAEATTAAEAEAQPTSAAEPEESTAGSPVRLHVLAEALRLHVLAEPLRPHLRAELQEAHGLLLLPGASDRAPRFGGRWRRRGRLGGEHSARRWRRALTASLQ